jgi:hypothetical protein
MQLVPPSSQRRSPAAWPRSRRPCRVQPSFAVLGAVVFLVMCGNSIGVVFALDFGEERKSPPTRFREAIEMGQLCWRACEHCSDAACRTTGAGRRGRDTAAVAVASSRQSPGARCGRSRVPLGRRFRRGTRPWPGSPCSGLLLGAGRDVGPAFELPSPGARQRSPLVSTGAGWYRSRCAWVAEQVPRVEPIGTYNHRQLLKNSVDRIFVHYAGEDDFFRSPSTNPWEASFRHEGSVSAEVRLAPEVT